MTSTLARGKPLKRTGFKRKPIERKPSPKLMPVELPPNVRPMAGPGEVKPMPKREVVKSEKLRQSARGEACTLMIPGVCSHDPERTVLCHLPGPIKGTKSTDLACSAYGCDMCHAALDRRTIVEAFEQDRQWFMRRAQTLTLARMLERGLIVVA